MEWILQNVPLLAFIFILISIVRAVLRARRMQEQDQRGGNETEQERRIREVQAEIRRKIAERRGERATEFPAHPVTAEQQRPTVFERGTEPPPVDSFGGRGTVRRLMERLEQSLEPPPPPVLPTSNRAELERQYQLEDELQAAENLRHQTRRRAASTAAAKDAAAQSEVVLRQSARDRLLTDLGDSESLRRAFVMREVLGPPVGLR